MSQKASRRGRRHTSEEDKSSLKPPTPKPNGIEETPPELTPPAEEPETEAQPPPPPPPEEESPKEPPPKEVTENENGIVTRSRSTTPQVKKVNGHEDEEEKTDVGDVSEADLEPDPSIATDEQHPELMFEENSDMESGKGSPVLSRCKTRRSISRNVPTPKTPKSVEGEVAGEEDMNATFESCSEDVSTKAQVGGDSTRLDYTDREEGNSFFLQEAKNKSFGETLRRLSTRRTIRPISEDYRKRLLQNNVEKNEYPSRNSVERISAVGIKRKSCSREAEECSKRFKGDSPGFFARLTSPLASIRNPFRADIPSSTPTLTGYKDEKCLIEDDCVNSKMCEVKDGERRWCSIM
ncbi:hypothetical protein TcasGA2_TC034872 [Tribolium castaneum]|uniref:Uncharacterized protein n=1 Tax=Tribolium castaneum TaxID=7070 RepID=A0A139WB73_TRICA|nr:PREDICTED: pre-mRNA-splicing ATP-dependent RNA helicase PRP28 [Tribolium castaneum]XP_015839101.1 PREDICTED: pre-mRNA-splicing ATP-dependent RNA helicase PRP28 [Tribolium castaneum]XP_015839102.1 PREDICTED: pre-mRNA-splicing ATP-dependent RNA helicase PRP28 [Tribolium castaneum]XP_015839103.1 PREDICTED: pre-mRNA-splicing ATP-dependent RNA helicase PRP28 [Tribolium castaneum]KYB25177.1 hypothetical protein TcasGA2_TC034872 [Tribolium castaneum]|eukprot:XP_015839100.1 PREDICTED: pre-mRNA-splicing ATP-dependent RNA helicase PRP28 [Tribolium castaneum]